MAEAANGHFVQRSTQELSNVVHSFGTKLLRPMTLTRSGVASTL
jgi:hypothetical protein